MTKNDLNQLIQQQRIPAEDWWCMALHKSPEWTTWWDEQLAWKHAVSMWPGNVGVLPFWKISGPDATRLLSDTCVNNFTNVKPGKVKHLIACRDDGKMVMDTMGLVMAPNTYEITMTVSRFLYTNRNGDYDVDISSVPPRSILQIAGPKSFELLQRFTSTNLNDIKFAHFTSEPVKFANYDAYLVRLTMSGDLGFEVQVPLEAGEEVFNAIWQAGQDLGIQKIGARNHLQQHVESGMVGMYGDSMFAFCEPEDPYYEFMRNIGDLTVTLGVAIPKVSGSFEPNSISDYYFSPVELGMSNIIDLNHEFPGRDALAKELKDPKRKLVILEWNKEDILVVYASMFSDGESHVEVNTEHYDYIEMPRDPKLPLEASTVLVDGRPVGFTTSRTYSYAYRRMISNCVIPIEYSKPGTQVTIVWGNPGHPQKHIRATVAKFPYKPDRTRGLPVER